MSRTNAPPRPHCYRKPLRPALAQHPRTTTALAHWAADELRSTNGQIEFLMRRALADAKRLPPR
jgi:hypothetical protein